MPPVLLRVVGGARDCGIVGRVGDLRVAGSCDRQARAVIAL